MGRLAIIDLGTNTFHLLIVDISDFLQNHQIIFRERKYVFLGEGNKNYIVQSSYDKGIKTLLEFSKIIKLKEVNKVVALGTEALRKTINGPAFCGEVYEKAGIKIEIIDGLREAELIAKGVSLLGMSDGDQLIMDIGGGSVEFIHIHNKEVQWSHSFKIGISVLYNSFHKSEPIEQSEIDLLNSFLEEQLSILWEQIDDVRPVLVGASGTFEVLADAKSPNKNQLIEVPFERFEMLYSKLRFMNLKEREKSTLIAKERAKYIVVALHLVKLVVQRLNIKKCFVSPYAMKEGAIAEHLDLD